MKLSERKMKILEAVVSFYIETGEPVGSKLIAADLGVSSATVRNEMAELSQLGYLLQPHTSAGRIPSQSGYRMYFDNSFDPKLLDATEKHLIDTTLSAGLYDTNRFFQNAVHLTAHFSRQAAIATTPSGVSAKVRAVQFVQTSRRTAMIVLMASTGTIKTKIFHCDFDLSPEIMRIFFRVFNEKLAGMSVAKITPAFIQTLGSDMGDMMLLMASAVKALYDIACDTVHTDVCIDGHMNLMFHPECLKLLERPREMSNLICGFSEPLSIKVGTEIGRKELSEAGLVSQKYFVNGEEAGAIAVLGPMRMDYGKTAAILEYIASQLGKMLTRFMEEE